MRTPFRIKDLLHCMLPLAGAAAMIVFGQAAVAGQGKKVIDCPGREDRQFLPNEGEKAKEWAAGLSCSKETRCPQKRPCNKNVVIAHRKKYIAATVRCICEPKRKEEKK